MPDRNTRARGQPLQSITLLMGLNVVLGVLAYRELLTFQPRMYSVATGLEADAEQYLFTPNETAPLIVALMSLWLVHHRRAALFSLPQRSGAPVLAAAALVPGMLLYLWAIYTSAPDLQGLSLVLNLIGGLILWRGWPAVKVCAIPLVLLLYAVPLPSPLIAKTIWSFQLASAQLAGWMLYVIGIPHAVSAEMIYLPEDTYQVIESCSGFRSILTLSMFAILMADLFHRSRLHLAILLAVSLPVAFLMNGLRVTTLILNPASQIHTIHVGQGLVVLMAGLTLLYLLDGALGRMLGARARRGPLAPEILGDAAVAAPLFVNPMHRVGAVTVLFVAMLGALYALPSWTFRGVAGFALEETLDRATTGWVAADLPAATNDLSSVAFRESVRRQYARPGKALLRGNDPPVEIFVGVGEHLNRFKSPFSPKNAVPGRGWVIEEEGLYEIEANPRGEAVVWQKLRSGPKRVLAYHWYDGDRGIVEESFRAFFGLDRSLFAREQPVIAVRLSTPIGEATEASVRQAHGRLKRAHELVSGAVEDMKSARGARIRAETALIPNYPLWETFFTHPSSRMWEKLNEFKHVSGDRPVA